MVHSQFRRRSACVCQPATDAVFAHSVFVFFVRTLSIHPCFNHNLYNHRRRMLLYFHQAHYQPRLAREFTWSVILCSHWILYRAHDLRTDWLHGIPVTFCGDTVPFLETLVWLDSRVSYRAAYLQFDISGWVLYPGHFLAFLHNYFTALVSTQAQYIFFSKLDQEICNCDHFYAIDISFEAIRDSNLSALFSTRNYLRRSIQLVACR